MSRSSSKAFSILESSILSKPRMMGTPAEKETTKFILDFLDGTGLSPYTEEIEWSSAYVIARKVMSLLLILWLGLLNISLCIGGKTGGIISVVLPILAIFFVVLLLKAIMNDKFSYLGKMFSGKNVICDLPPGSEKEPKKIIYFTAHTDSVGSSMPKLNVPLTVGSLLFFLISLGTTLVGGITQLEGNASGTFNVILLIVSIVNGLMIVISLFARRVDTSPGAIDNGSGTAILLSLAEYFQGKSLDQSTLRFIFCAAEEWGLYGSKGYVKAHRDELEENINRDLLINVDMVGSELAYVNKGGLIFRKALNKELNRLIEEVAGNTGIEARAFSTPLVNNSDHAPFLKLKDGNGIFSLQEGHKIYPQTSGYDRESRSTKNGGCSFIIESCGFGAGPKSLVIDHINTLKTVARMSDCFLLLLVSPLILDKQNDQKDRQQEIPIDDRASVAGRKVIVLDHVQDMGQTRTPHESGFGDDEGQPERTNPETQEAYYPYSDGCKPQLHLKSAVQRPADPGSDLVSIKDMSKQSANDCEPTCQAYGVDSDDFNCAFPAFFISGGKQMNRNGYDCDRDLEIDIQTGYFK